MTLLTNHEVAIDPETGVPWTDRAIARRCSVSAPLVGQIRSSVTVNIYSDNEPRAYTTKHGTVAVMNTASIGKPAAPVVLASSEPAPIPETAPLVEEVEAERAHRRKLAAGGGDQKSGVEKIPQAIEDTGKARDKAAKAVGTNGKRAERMGKQILHAANDNLGAALKKSPRSVPFSVFARSNVGGCGNACTPGAH